MLRENDDLKGEIERLKLRIQSLQTHIDSLQKYNGIGGDISNLSSINGNSRVAQMEEQLVGAQEQVGRLEAENAQLITYIQKYEQKI